MRVPWRACVPDHRRTPHVCNLPLHMAALHAALSGHGRFEQSQVACDGTPDLRVFRRPPRAFCGRAGLRSRSPPVHPGLIDTPRQSGIARSDRAAIPYWHYEHLTWSSSTTPCPATLGFRRWNEVRGPASGLRGRLDADARVRKAIAASHTARRAFPGTVRK